MAISRRRQPPKTEEQPKFQCRDCGHSYDWHEIGANGKPFMAVARSTREASSVAFSQPLSANTSSNGR